MSIESIELDFTREGMIVYLMLGASIGFRITPVEEHLLKLVPRERN